MNIKMNMMMKMKNIITIWGKITKKIQNLSCAGIWIVTSRLRKNSLLKVASANSSSKVKIKVARNRERKIWASNNNN